MINGNRGNAYFLKKLKHGVTIKSLVNEREQAAPKN
jgi:hypothetical protein